MKIIGGFFCALRASCVQPAGRCCALQSVVADGGSASAAASSCKEENTHLVHAAVTQERKNTQIHDLRFSFVGGSHLKALLEEKVFEKIVCLVFYF